MTVHALLARPVGAGATSRRVALVVASLALAVGCAGPAIGQPPVGDPPAVKAARTPLITSVVVGPGPVAHIVGVARQKRVVIQVRSGKRWRTAARARVRRHAFSARVALSATKVGRVRIVGGGRSSKARPLPRAVAGEATGLADASAAPGAPVGPRQPHPQEPAGPSDECGPRPRKADGTFWSCSFFDDFDGTTLNRDKWVPQTDFNSGEQQARYACYRDDPKNVSVSGGRLRLTLRHGTTPRTCLKKANPATTYTSGGVMSYDRFSQQYGRFEARFSNTASTVPGLHEAFWLWPDARFQNPFELWPTAGEIDITETYSQHPSLAIPFLHYTWNDNGGPRPGVNTSWNCRAQRGTDNTYLLEWSPERIDISVNGSPCLTNTSANKAFDKRYIVALTMLIGTSDNRATDATPVPATMSVDYVRVWE